MRTGERRPWRRRGDAPEPDDVARAEAGGAERGLVVGGGALEVAVKVGEGNEPPGVLAVVGAEERADERGVGPATEAGEDHVHKVRHWVGGDCGVRGRAVALEGESRIRSGSGESMRRANPIKRARRGDGRLGDLADESRTAHRRFGGSARTSPAGMDKGPEHMDAAWPMRTSPVAR